MTKKNTTIAHAAAQPAPDAKPSTAAEAQAPQTINVIMIPAEAFAGAKDWAYDNLTGRQFDTLMGFFKGMKQGTAQLTSK